MPDLRRKCLPILWTKSILDYDPDSGVFRWRHRPDLPSKWNTRYAGTVAGFDVRGYTAIQLSVPERTNYYAHVLAWAYITGEWPKFKIDHKDRNRSNNAFSNLRPATDIENGQNKSIQKNNTSGVPGISFHKQAGMWRGRIYVGRRLVWDRLFKTVTEAATARAAVLPEFHGEFAAMP